MSRRRRAVTSMEEVAGNIETYVREVEKHAGLASRIKQHPAWYAVKDGAGAWVFGPSKFIGYHQANARDYLAGYSRKDGRETEPALSAWFDQVDTETPLGRELREEFIRFAERFGKTPNSRWRVSVTRDELDARRLPVGRGSEFDIADRIAYDPEICGGRPRIAGTRVRVSDILAALAEGASMNDILESYPYLTSDDISAALNYAAKTVEHRILKAA